MKEKSRPKLSKHSSSSRRWLDRQHADPYVQQAKKAGYRSRAVYKLLEIQQRDKILAPGMRVVDLGAAPGGWSQVAAQCVGQKGYVLAMDILAMDFINGVDIVQGDFQEAAVLEILLNTLKGKSVDWVLSDMAPNLSGIPAADQARSIDMAEGALAFAECVLVQGGGMLVKIFQGTGSQEYLAALKARFRQVLVRKPKASRKESREIYVLAKGYSPYCVQTERNEGHPF